MQGQKDQTPEAMKTQNAKKQSGKKVDWMVKQACLVDRKKRRTEDWHKNAETGHRGGLAINDKRWKIPQVKRKKIFSH